MPIAYLTLELRIEGAHSLKDKRQAVRSVKDRLRNTFNVAVAEIDSTDLSITSFKPETEQTQDTNFTLLEGVERKADAGKYDVSIIGDYNIGGDAWASRRILEDMGLRVIAQWSGDGTLQELASAHRAKVSLLHCYRSMNYISTHLEEEYGIPWEEYNFFGPTKIVESMRRIAEHFDDSIKEKTEQAITRYEPYFAEVKARYGPRLAGKRVMLMLGGLRPRHTIGASGPARGCPAPVAPKLRGRRSRERSSYRCKECAVAGR